MIITKLSKKCLLYFVSIFLTLDCMSAQLKKPTEENQNPGAVGFCLVYHDKYADLSGIDLVINTDWIEFAEKVADLRYNLVLLENEPFKQEQNIIYINNYCYLITGLKPGIQYSITNVMASYEGLQSKTHVKARLNPVQSDKTLPILINPGKIDFLGVFVVSSIVTETKGKKDLFAMVTGKKIPTLIHAGNFWENISNKDYIKKTIYGKNELTDSEAEKIFFKEVVKNEKKGYWYEIAAKRLADLDVK